MDFDRGELIVWTMLGASIALLMIVGYVKDRRSAREGPVAKLGTFGSFGDIAIGAVVDSRGRRFVSVTFPLVDDQSGNMTFGLGVLTSAQADHLARMLRVAASPGRTATLARFAYEKKRRALRRAP